MATLDLAHSSGRLVVVQKNIFFLNKKFHHADIVCLFVGVSADANIIPL